MVTLNKENNNDSNLLKHIMFRYFPYWPLFLSLMIICAAGAYIYTHLATPVYESTAKILIDDEKKGTKESEAIESLDKISSGKIIENEIEIIQSKSLLNEVVNKLGLYASVHRENTFRNTSAYTTSPVSILIQDTDKIVATDKIPFTLNKKNNLVTVGLKTYSINQWNNTKYGVIKFVPNKNYINNKDTGKFYFQLLPVKDVVNSIAGNLTVAAPTKESSILNLSLKDADAIRGKNTLNEILVAYKLSVNKEKNTLAASTLDFIDSRLSNVGHELDSIEGKVQQFKSGDDAVDVSTQSKLYLQNVNDNNQKLSDINIQLDALNQVQNYVQSKNENDGIVPSLGNINDPLLTQLLDKLATAQIDYDNLKKTTGENNPIVVSVQQQIQKIKPNILENIQSHKNILLATKENLSAINYAFSGRINSIPGKERQLTDISRQQSIKNDLYDFLLQKKEETSLSLLSNQSGSKIIDQADFSNDPVSPNKKLAYIASFIIALFTGIGIVMSKESLGQKIMFRHDIEKLTNNPVIAEITAGDLKDNNLLEYDTKTLLGQQFRNLRTALGYFNVNSARRKRILITSAISGEGKSFIAANLAITLAITGKKVVLVDFDLNNPSLSKKLGFDKEKMGIADYLIDNVSPEEIIQETNFHKNVSGISAGNLSDDAAEIITGEQVETLLNYLDNNFDYIIIDSAPIVHVSDAYMLSSFCDTTLYVIRHSYTPKVFIEQIEENDKTNGLKNVAIVFNDVRNRGYKNKYYGYGHTYSYLYNNKKSTKQIALLKTNSNN